MVVKYCKARFMKGRGAISKKYVLNNKRVQQPSLPHQQHRQSPMSCSGSKITPNPARESWRHDNILASSHSEHVIT